MKGDFAKSIVVFERNALRWRSRPNLDEKCKKHGFGPPPGLESNPANGVPFKVTLLNTPHLLRKAARFARARFARASRALRALFT